MPLGKYPTFAACVADYIKSGKSEEQARRICGRIQEKIEGGNNGNKKGGGYRTKSANQLPASLRAPLERSEKALKFLEENSALVDTSLDSPTSNSFADTNLSNSSSIQPQEEQQESYTDKITRIMDEYGVDEPTAVETVNRLIKEEQEELAQQQLEIQKQIELQRRAEATAEPPQQPEQPQQQEEGQEPLAGEEPEQQQPQNDENAGSPQ